MATFGNIAANPWAHLVHVFFDNSCDRPDKSL